MSSSKDGTRQLRSLLVLDHSIARPTDVGYQSAVSLALSTKDRFVYTSTEHCIMFDRTDVTSILAKI